MTTTATDRFTITPDPTPARTPALPARWHELTFHDGRKVTGKARVTSYVDKTRDRHPAGDPWPYHVVIIDLSPTLNHEDGSTLYRDANPDADEVDSWDAVIRHPVRVNGVAYSGSLYVKRAFNETNGRHLDDDPRGRWLIDHGYLDRVPHSDNVTDAARSRLHDLAREVADTFGTTERLRADRLRDAEGHATRMKQDLDKAQAAYDIAATALHDLRLLNDVRRCKGCGDFLDDLEVCCP